jgi:hypothetical protein
MLTRPPRDRVRVGIGALAAGALIAAATVLATGDPVVAPGRPIPAAQPTAMDTDGDGVLDGMPMQELAAGSDTASNDTASNDTTAAEQASLGGVPAAEQPPTDGPEPVGAATPVDAVRGFVASLGAGDRENAFRLMHPRYREAFGSFAEFGEDAPVGRFGPFAALGGAAYQSAVFDAAPDGEAVAIVSGHGEIVRERVPVTESVSLVARRGPTGWLVEAPGEGGSVFQIPGTAGDQVSAPAALVVWTPSVGLAEAVAVVDGQPREAAVTELADPIETAEIRVTEYSPGGQQAAVGVLREDGAVDVVSTWFVA